MYAYLVMMLGKWLHQSLDPFLVQLPSLWETYEYVVLLPGERQWRNNNSTTSQTHVYANDFQSIGLSYLVILDTTNIIFDFRIYQIFFPLLSKITVFLLVSFINCFTLICFNLWSFWAITKEKSTNELMTKKHSKWQIWTLEPYKIQKLALLRFSIMHKMTEKIVEIKVTIYKYFVNHYFTHMLILKIF